MATIHRAKRRCLQYDDDQHFDDELTSLRLTVRKQLAMRNECLTFNLKTLIRS
jgi:hypothetical protein